MNKILAVTVILGVLMVSTLLVTPAASATNYPKGCNSGIGWQRCIAFAGGLEHLNDFRFCCQQTANIMWMDVPFP